MMTFLIDDISNTGVLAFTTDNEKVKYNLSLIPEVTNSIEALMVKSKHGGSKFVFSIGKFIVVYQGSITMQKQSMFFFDYRVDPMHAHLVHTDLFSENIVGEFNKLSALMAEGLMDTSEEITFSDLANPTSSYN